VLQAAKRVANEPNLHFYLVGKADRVGTDAFNMRLSRQRAYNVRDELISAGVHANRIETRWVGDHALPVPTRHGVRERRNRVVEISLG